jgi:hypothetical protein
MASLSIVYEDSATRKNKCQTDAWTTIRRCQDSSGEVRRHGEEKVSGTIV